MKFFGSEYKKLTKYEKDLVDFINAYPKVFGLSTIHKIAHACFVSSGVISRLYKKLGFESLKEMQFFVLQQEALTMDIENSKTFETDEVELATKNLLNYYQTSIIQTTDNIEKHKIQKAVDLICEAKQVYLFGNGLSSISCLTMLDNLQKVGIAAYYEQDFHKLLLNLSNFESGSIFFIFSKSCFTKEFKFLIPILKAKKINYIIVTANRVISQEHPFVITYKTKEQPKRFNSISSKISQLLISDLIFELIKLKKINDDDIDKHYQFLDKWNQ